MRLESTIGRLAGTFTRGIKGPETFDDGTGRRGLEIKRWACGSDVKRLDTSKFGFGVNITLLT